jgi:hypothetical protein
MAYMLYSTFEVDPKQKPMTIKQKKKLCSALTCLTDQEKKEAVFLLIVEHFRREKQSEIDIGDFVLPYSGTEKNKNITFDLNDFPPKLCWILWKFLGKQDE